MLPPEVIVGWVPGCLGRGVPHQAPLGGGRSVGAQVGRHERVVLPGDGYGLDTRAHNEPSAKFTQ